MGIYAALAETDQAAVLRQHGGKGFGAVQGGAGRAAGRQADADRGGDRRLLADVAAIDAVLREGAARAAAIADPIVAEAERLVGFLRV